MCICIRHDMHPLKLTIILLCACGVKENQNLLFFLHAGVRACIYAASIIRSACTMYMLHFQSFFISVFFHFVLAIQPPQSMHVKTLSPAFRFPSDAWIKLAHSHFSSCSKCFCFAILFACCTDYCRICFVRQRENMYELETNKCTYCLFVSGIAGPDRFHSEFPVSGRDVCVCACGFWCSRLCMFCFSSVR